MYSTTEYCAHVWLNGTYTKEIYSQLNHGLRIIFGTLKFITTQWIPMLCNIGSLTLRSKHALLNEWKKCVLFPSLPLHSYGAQFRKLPRCKSKKYPWRIKTEINTSNFILEHAWNEEWASFMMGQNYGVTSNVPGHDHPRTLWSTLNRVRIDHGRYSNLMHKWKILPTPNCHCGYFIQSISYIIGECPNKYYVGSSGGFLVCH